VTWGILTKAGSAN